MDLSQLRFLNPVRIAAGLRQRGVSGAVAQGMRKAGTALDRALVGPASIRLNPMGFVCNHACPMCWLQNYEKDDFKQQLRIDREQGMKLAEYEALFDAMPPGLEEVNLVGGGEPLVHPQCLELMEAVKRRGWRGSLISNGSLLKEKAGRTLVEMGWDYTRISVHGGDVETYRQIQGVDHFETTRGNLKAYTRLRTGAAGKRQGHLCIFHVLQHENIASIDKLFAFAEEVGADSLLFEKIIPLGPGMELSVEELQRAREALVACARDCKIPVNLADVLPALEKEAHVVAGETAWVPARRCSVGFDQAFVTALGDVMPCCFSSEVMGNLRKQNFRQIWFGEKYKEFRARLNHGKFAPYCISNRCTMKGVLHN